MAAGKVVLANLAAGLVLGAAGRVVMRIIALAVGIRPGFSIGGTTEVILMGVIIGAPAGVLYGVVRRFVPGGYRRAGLFGVLTFAALALWTPPAARSAMAAAGNPVGLAVGLFGALFVGYGLLVETLLRSAVGGSEGRGDVGTAP